ncbi:transposon Ty3-I Gag-Pol polyprotein [Trichonephila clavipes]|nr:transposon Ty3-I Gag-Pol polyprotein [Trichonephila clavipes]
MIRWALKLSEFNIEWEQRPGVQNVVAGVLSRNPIGNMDGSQILCASLRALALNSREQLIREQREDPELGHIYRYLENPDDGSVNATVCEGWSQDFKLIDDLLFYAKYSTTLGELRVYIPQSLREAIMQEFHDLPLAGHLGKRKTTTRSKGHSAAEGRPVRSRQKTAARPCPYYLRSHLKEPEGIPEEQRSTGIYSLQQNSLKERRLSMEALDGDPADRRE